MLRRLSYIVCLFLLLVTAPLRAQWSYDGSSWWNTDYNSTEGTEFYVTYMLNYGSQQEDQDIHLQLFATARQDANVQVYAFTEYGLQEKIHEFTVPAGGRSGHQEIPNEKTYLRNVGKQYKSIYVTSDTPISLYAYNYLDGSQDATCVYPVKTNFMANTLEFANTQKNNLLKEYVIQTFNTDGVATEFAVIATEDNTELDILLKETSFNRFNRNTLSFRDTLSVDTIISETLNKGEVYYYRSSSARAKRSPENTGNINFLDKFTSLAGTKICSNNNIVVYQGGQHAEIPTNSGTKNHIWTQSLPHNLWGKQYVYAKTKNLTKDCIHITAAQNNSHVKVQVENDIVLDTIINQYATLEYYLTDSYCYISSDKAITCYSYFPQQYPDAYDAQTIAPAMFPVLPIEQRVKSTLYATFENSNIEDNFITVIVPINGINSMYIKSSNGNSNSSMCKFPCMLVSTCSAQPASAIGLPDSTSTALSKATPDKHSTQPPKPCTNPSWAFGMRWIITDIAIMCHSNERENDCVSNLMSWRMWKPDTNIPLSITDVSIVPHPVTASIADFALPDSWTLVCSIYVLVLTKTSMPSPRSPSMTSLPIVWIMSSQRQMHGNTG